MAGAGTVMVVEDERGVRELVSAVLRHAGYDVVIAPNGTLAVRFAEKHRPEVVLLDLHLPDVDGFTVARELLEAIPTRVVMLTGDKDEQSKLRGRAAGAHTYLTKPITPAALLAAVGEALTAPATPPPPTG